jgi:lipopolysaccharide export system permease protein
MTTIDRHIIRRLLTGFLFLITVLIVFFVVLHYVEHVDEFFDRGATTREIFLQYYPSYIPEIVKLTSPVALFLSAIYLTARLAQKLQLMALSTSGVSLYRISAPFLAVALLVTGFMFWFNGWIVPRANQERMAFEEQYLQNVDNGGPQRDIYRRTSPTGVISVGYYNPEKQTAHDVSLYTLHDDQTLASRLDSPSMQWNDSLEVWQIDKGVRRTFNNDRITRRGVSAKDTTFNLFPRDLARSGNNVDRLTIPVAAEFIESLRRSGAENIGQPLVAYYSKFAYPLANFILVLVGVPLASIRRRGGQAVQIGIGLAITFFYLSLIKLVEPFGYAEIISPLAAVWIPHGFFFLLGLGVMVYTRR